MQFAEHCFRFSLRCCFHRIAPTQKFCLFRYVHQPIIYAMIASHVSTDNGCAMVGKTVHTEMMKASKIAKIKRAETINSSVII